MNLSAQHISVAMGGADILKDVSLNLGAGELVGLIGPNGAGKSTLMKAMLGLRSRSAGDVSVDGRALVAMDAHERARTIAYLPQDRRVEWRLAAYDVVMLGRYPHRPGFGGPAPTDHAAVQRALEAVDASALSDRVVADLSGGERSRVLLARALAVEAPLLLADEPTAALDPYHQLHVMEILRERARAGAGVLVVLHDLTLAARFTDRLVLLDHGRVVADDAPMRVLTPERLAQIYGVIAQTGEFEGLPFVTPWTRRS